MVWEIVRWSRAIKQQGGLFNAVKAFWVLSDVKEGVLVGKDSLGNRYYEKKDETVWGVFYV
jgi:hypothetical protein